MSEVTVKQLASTVGIPVERLLTQLQDAGIRAIDADATLTEQERVQLLAYLRRSHGKGGEETAAAPSQITLKRKSVSELRQPTPTPRSTGSRPAPTAGRAAKTVSVEVRRKRTYVKRGEETRAAGRGAGADATSRSSGRGSSRSAEVGAEARRRSELEALRAEQEARRLADQEAQEAREIAEREAAELSRREAAEQRRREEKLENQRAAEAEQAAREAAVAQAEATRLAELQAPKKPREAAADSKSAGTTRRSTESAVRTRKPTRKAADTAETERDKAAKKSARKRDGDSRRAIYEEIDGGDSIGRGGRRRRRSGKAQLQDQHGFQKPTAPVQYEVEIPEAISVGELANRMSVKAAEVVKELFKQGMMVTINQMLDRDTATIVVEELGHKPVTADERDAEGTLFDEMQEQADQYEALPRPPVVTIMGHVDHGKTSLLDHIRRTRVASGEAGGITQHIGAYCVRTDKGMVSFLDTPGHAAFSAMRARGAEVTDIVILVVAADDGVMPQTIEAIQHARASKVPLIVAINKIDKPEANPERVLQELTQHEVLPEEWGGDTMTVKVSAKSGEGIDDLLDAILLQAEVLELSAPTQGLARGTIIESSLDKGRGPMATVLVQAGTLSRGDVIVSGAHYGRVRAMLDETGQPTESAGPSVPVQVLGLSGTPNAGDDVISVSDDKRAREVAEFRTARSRQSRLDEQQGASLDQLFSQLKEGELKTVNIILKADVQGSLEALRESLLKLTNDEVKVVIVGSGVGGITGSDANLAVTSNAILLGFNVRADAAARRVIEDKGLDLRYYSIIYELIDDVKQAISGMLSPIVTEEIIGLAEVRDVFRSSKFGAIAGCIVVDGTIKRSNPIRVLRDNVVIYEGALESLRRFKEDVNEVRSGTECGIGVKNYNDVKPGDSIEVFERTERAREL